MFLFKVFTKFTNTMKVWYGYWRISYHENLTSCCLTTTVHIVEGFIMFSIQCLTVK